jgi:hypothetical protein
LSHQDFALFTNAHILAQTAALLFPKPDQNHLSGTPARFLKKGKDSGVVAKPEIALLIFRHSIPKRIDKEKFCLAGGFQKKKLERIPEPLGDKNGSTF